MLVLAKKFNIVIIWSHLAFLNGNRENGNIMMTLWNATLSMHFCECFSASGVVKWCICSSKMCSSRHFIFIWYSNAIKLHQMMDHLSQAMACQSVNDTINREISSGVWKYSLNNMKKKKNPFSSFHRNEVPIFRHKNDMFHGSIEIFYWREIFFFWKKNSSKVKFQMRRFFIFKWSSCAIFWLNQLVRLYRLANYRRILRC